FDRDHQVLHHQGGPVDIAKPFKICSGGEELGVLLVGGKALSRLDLVAVEQALPLIALEFMKIHASQQQQEQVQATLFRDVIESDPIAIRHLVQQYGLHDMTWRIVAAASEQRDALSHLTRQLRNADALFTTIEAAIIVIAKPHVLPLLTQWQNLYSHVLVWGEAPASSREISEQLRSTLALWKIITHNAEFLIRAPQIEFHLRDYPEILLLESLLPTHRARYLGKVLGPILGDAELVRTLRAWILLNRSFRLAADCLHTHPNTIRYRIDRIAEMLERNFQNDQAVMPVRLAVLWMDLPETKAL
ncbi:MAG: helix-turn-helix domain-containing protein, partial [Firmicutes bacterium]|nr:helix-turn-helix domain-containing protein [Bacillota bacterium]